MSGVRVSLCGNININLQKHNLRNGWKIFCWNKFLASGLHEAVDLQNVPVNRVLACDWKRIRLVMHKASARLVVLVPRCPPPGFMTGTSMAIVLVCGVPRLALGIIFAGVVLLPRLNAPSAPAMLFFVFSVGCVSEILQRS